MKILTRICIGVITSLCFITSGHAQPKIGDVSYEETNQEIIVTGSSFGDGPNVVFFENFESGPKYSNILANVPGRWASDALPYKEFSGNTTHTAKDPVAAEKGEKGLSQIIVKFGKEYSEAFISFSVKIPEGATFPGASQPRTFSPMSSWKFAWLYSGETGYAADDLFDICLPTHTGGGSFAFGGNNGTLVWLDHGSTWWEWDNFNHMANYIRFDPIAPKNKPVSYFWKVINNKVNITKAGTASPSKLTSSNLSFDRINVPGWWGNGDNRNFNGLYDNFYIAVGANSRARATLTDNKSYSKSKFAIAVMAKSWEDSRIVLHSDSIPDNQAFYLHIFDKDNKAVSNPRRICPKCPKTITPR